MANWLEVCADEDTEFQRYGGELFRRLKSLCMAVVETYNSRYVAGGAEFMDSFQGNPNCFRVRLANRTDAAATPGDRYVEVFFRPETRRISVARANAAVVPGKAMPQSLSGDVPMEGAGSHNELKFMVGGTAAGATAPAPKSAEEVSRLLLEPLFFPTGTRPEPIAS